MTEEETNKNYDNDDLLLMENYKFEELDYKV